MTVNRIEEHDLERRECAPAIALASSIQSVPRHETTTFGKELMEEPSNELCEAKNQEKIADSYSGSSLELEGIHYDEALFFFNNSESDDLDPFNLF